MGDLFTASPRTRAAAKQRQADQAQLDASRAQDSSRQDFAAPIADKRAEDAAAARAEAAQLYQQDNIARRG